MMERIELDMERKKKNLPWPEWHVVNDLVFVRV